MFTSDFFIKIIEQLINYSYYYPLFMAYIWMIGAVYYYFHWERGTDPDSPPKLDKYPLVSILVPCYNEENHIQETIDYLLKTNYPNFEIIAVNDGSSDNTGKILKDIQSKHKNIRVIEFAKNQGKAIGLNSAAMISNGEYLICIDGDAILDPNAITWMMSHFLNGPRVGAVTGNPRIRNRSSLLGKIQIGEFSAIVGIIKRAQRIYGRVFTVSGVIVAFRKSAIHKIGYWHTDMVTDDIDISWRLELNHWNIRYEPNAICWMLVPETMKGLWKQRLRWAQGGAEVLKKYFKNIFDYKSRRMWGIYAEYFLSLIWAYSAIFTLIIWILGHFINMPEGMKVPTLVPSIYGTFLGITFLLQFAISLFIDSKYEKGVGRYYYWIIWYPFAFWIINVFTTTVGFIKAMFKEKGKRAVWDSPDRGIGD
ncbi:poly-beta-1,6 N-acetyl-D-glucosamine synthase [Nautilia sp. PV-1]|uniref:poly-beta-1,6-N-acetyl-D-glucosamine synthase n=1 Tax=Nautilia sp. PV-1 TaxID=2579250 RepID=UPI000FD84942|nr:poly-beta-1,6-N-acetyl-D-glucosamine synthase [Nautilia sp. PV-1]AZV47434.1 poly-beta-1,6 N-acetyl-D-glucosamine synthase [Nautilia sp. PV-1]